MKKHLALFEKNIMVRKIPCTVHMCDCHVLKFYAFFAYTAQVFTLLHYCCITLRNHHYFYFFSYFLIVLKVR